MNWQHEYQRKLVSADEAVSVIKSGDLICCPLDSEPLAVGLALTARAADLEDVEIEVAAPTNQDLGWYDPWATDRFRVKAGFIPRFAGPALRKASDEKRVDFQCAESALYLKGVSEGRPGHRRADACMLEVSPPDANGFCSFGNSMWDKKRKAESAKIVIAQINNSFIRTYGDNFIHVSQIDYFVESAQSGRSAFVGMSEVKPPPEAGTIAESVSTLIRDGDTIAVGIGVLTEGLLSAGVFDNKSDLGFHTERTPRGAVRLIRDGVFNGRRKSLHPGKVVATCIPLAPGDEEFVHSNPIIELYDISYTNAIPTIAANDNFAAILGGIAIDLTGQFTGESIGRRMYSGTGGLPNFLIGAAYSKGGRSIIALPSTAAGGSMSRIVPALEPGTIVTAQRPYIDYVVTEFGIANLFGKSQRERAQELISVAHPDFRHELLKEARRLYWP